MPASTCARQWGMCPVATARAGRPTSHRCRRGYAHPGEDKCEDCEPLPAPLEAAAPHPVLDPGFYA